MPTLVLLHAFPLDSRTWRRLVPLLEDEVRLVPLDLPGLGRRPAPDTRPSMEAVATDVLSRLDDAGIEQAHVMGISTGGYVALELARSHRERVTSLLLASTTPWLIAPDDPDERRATALELRRTLTTDAVAGSADEGLGPTAHREQPELRDELTTVIAQGDPLGVAWMADAIASRHDTSATLAAFPGRVTLLFGGQDEATPPERGRDMLALRATGSDSELVVLDGVGHLTPLEAPEDVAVVVRRHLGLADSRGVSAR